MKKTSTTAPSLVETAHNAFRQKIHTINFDIVLPSEEGGEYEYESLEIAPGRFNYDNIVADLVRYKYPDDAMTATINNYLADPDDETAEAEFQAMQAWRKSAKALAKKALAEASGDVAQVDG